MTELPPCACGCGDHVKRKDRKYLHNHHRIGKTHSAETRAKQSASSKGRKPSSACAAAAKKANTGRVHTAETRAKLRGRTGEKNPNWKGDHAKYNAVHLRLVKTKTRTCDNCNRSDRPTESALIRDRGIFYDEWAGWFSPRPEDYRELCRSCHDEYDGKSKR